MRVSAFSSTRPSELDQIEFPFASAVEIWPLGTRVLRESGGASSAGRLSDPAHRRTRNYVLGTCFSLTAMNVMERQQLAIAAGATQAEFLLSDTQLGMLTRFAFVVMHVAVGIPISSPADRTNRRNLIAMGLVAPGRAKWPPKGACLSEYLVSAVRKTRLETPIRHRSRKIPFWTNSVSGSLVRNGDMWLGAPDERCSSFCSVVSASRGPLEERA